MKIRKSSVLVPVLLIVLALMTTGTGLAQVGGPGGLHTTPLYADQDIDVGLVSVWNTNQEIIIQTETSGGWLISEIYIYAGYPSEDPIPMNNKGNPTVGKFPYTAVYEAPTTMHTLALSLKDNLDFSWGSGSIGRRHPTFAVHATLIQVDAYGQIIGQEGAWAYGPHTFENNWGWYASYNLAHPMRGQFIDAPVQGLSYHGPTQHGVTGADGYGGFLFFPGENIEFAIGSVSIGVAPAAKKVSPLDLFVGADVDDERAINVARILQTLDADQTDQRIDLLPEVVSCFESVVGGGQIDFSDNDQIDNLVNDTVQECNGAGGVQLVAVSAVDAKGNLEAGLNASGIFRKNISKTEDWGEDKHKEAVMPVYLPALRSDNTPSYCDMNDNGVYDEGIDTIGVPYEEWRLNGDPGALECDPRDDTNGNGEADGDDGICSIALIECRDIAKPLVMTYLEEIDIYDDQVTTGFWPGRFAYDTFTAVSRDDGTTWKRMNVSRMADLSSMELETGEPFPGTSGSPYLKADDNYLLVVWESKFCRSGNPRYSITRCDDPATEEVEADDPLTEENECAIYCRGNAEQGTEVCEPDYPGDDPYYVTDIWGVRGQQQSVNYDEVDDVADLGIGEIPYSCLWAARGVVVTQRELDAGTFASLNTEDDPTTEEDETKTVALGDIIWFKPERLTSGRRDAYIPTVSSARGGGFAIAWQEDPDGLRPGKGKGPGEGWSGAISNHKSDIWYSFIRNTDFAIVDANFVPGGPGDDPNGEAQYDEKPGLGRPKAQVPFSLPVRVSDNDMVNTDTLKVQLNSGDCKTPPNGTNEVCFPEVVDGTYVPLDPAEIANLFCDGPAPVADCCDPEHMKSSDAEYDPNCEDVKGLYGNLTGTKRYAYMARSIDEIDNATGLYVPNGDGIPDYQYYVDRDGVLDLCDMSETNSYMDALPGTSARERWFGFANVAGASKLVCVTSDGRLLDGDVSASRPMLQLMPYTKTVTNPDGTTSTVTSAWAMLAYEESKGMGHSLAASENETTDATSNPVDEIITGDGKPDDSGQDKPIKQDLGKNMIYHSFDFTEPDLVAPGHLVNLPALCGGLYPTYCGEDYEGTNPTCTCDPGQPVPLYFDNQECADPEDPATCEWMPDDTKFLQYRTEIARRARFIIQGKSKMGANRTVGAIIYKQGQEGQGRPADVFIRRFVVPTTDKAKDNPFRFENFECKMYLDQSFTLPACPNGQGDKPSATGYVCNVWGEASGDRLCGGVFTDPNGGYLRRDHINLTSHDIDYSVDAGPVDDTPEDPTDDLYGTDKVLLWSQHPYNLGDESFGDLSGTGGLSGMFSNARSHRGFIRGDFLGAAYSWSPNWAAGRNGNDRYNFYVRRSFDGGQTWTTTPASLNGTGVHYCREWRSDPTVPDPDGTGNAPPVFEGFDPECVAWCAPDDVECIETGEFIGAGAFEPARNVSQIENNKESSGDPRIGATPVVYPINGSTDTIMCPKMGAPGSWECIYPEDEWVDNFFFVAWGTVDNVKSTGAEGAKPEASPLDIYYTRSSDYGDTYLKIPWVIGGVNSNLGYGETVWRYDFMAKGEPERQGDTQLQSTSDGSKVYAFYHSYVDEETDPETEEPYSRWYPWKPEVTFENDLWFRRVIFWPDQIQAQ